MKTINGGNYFHEKAFNEICKTLERGEAVQVYIDCIGHTRNNNEQEAYKEALENKYGDKLQTTEHGGAYSYSYSYQLKQLVVKMRKHKLDLKQSKVVYEHCKQYIQIKHCYNNVFEVVTDYISKFRENEWKVAYGYTEIMAGLYCRHCFILDENDNVIDPTLYAQNKQQLERAYYVMAVFDDVDEYLKAIEENDLMPALEKHLREQDKQAQQWANENGVIFIG